MIRPHPPRPAAWLFALISRSENRPSIIEDYEEMYDDLARARGL